MKYEICKGTKQGGVWIWSAVAWTDTRNYAEDVMRALFWMHGKKYAVLCDGKVITES